MRVLVAALLAVGQGNGWVRERRQQLFEPILVDRVNVGTGNDNKLAACNGTSPIQRAAKREVLGADRNKLDREARCDGRSEEHTSELQSLMRTSYAGFCLKKQTQRE